MDSNDRMLKPEVRGKQPDCLGDGRRRQKESRDGLLLCAESALNMEVM